MISILRKRQVKILTALKMSSFITKTDNYDYGHKKWITWRFDLQLDFGQSPCGLKFHGEPKLRL